MEPEQSKSTQPDKEPTVAASAADVAQQTSTEAADTSAVETAASAKVARASGGRAIAVFALLVSVLALAAGGYAGYLYYERQQPFNAELVATMKSVQGDARQLEENVITSYSIHYTKLYDRVLLADARKLVPISAEREISRQYLESYNFV